MRIMHDAKPGVFLSEEEGAFLREQVTMQDEVPSPEGVEATRPDEVVTV